MKKVLLTILVFVACLNSSKGQYTQLNAQCTITVTPTTATICAGHQQAIFIASGANSYRWISLGDTVYGDTMSYSSFTPYTSIINVEGTVGACTSVTTVTLIVYPMPQVNFSIIGVDSGCVPLCITFSNTSPSIFSYSWQFWDGGTTTSSLYSPTHCFMDTVRPTGFEVIVTDTIGCSGSNGGSVYPYSCTGIENGSSLSKQLMFYPNPANNSLQVSYSGNIESTSLIITDMLGNSIHHQIFKSSNFQINVADLAEGVYNLSMQNNDGVSTKKLVIVR